jgi:hypothetical protein
MTEEEFSGMIRDEVGLPVTPGDLDRGFDELPGWDSVHLLAIAASIESHAQTPVTLPDLLEAGNLRSIYELAAR